MALEYFSPLIDTFNSSIAGSIGLAAVMFLGFLAIVLFLSRVDPRFTVLLLTPLISVWVVYGFGLPSWVRILVFILMGAGLAVFVYAKLS